MRVTKWGADRANSDVMSGILDCASPDCGGSMGGAGSEFQCQGKCQLAQSAIKRGTNGRNVSGHAVWSQ